MKPCLHHLSASGIEDPGFSLKMQIFSPVVMQTEEEEDPHELTVILLLFKSFSIKVVEPTFVNIS